MIRMADRARDGYRLPESGPQTGGHTRKRLDDYCNVMLIDCPSCREPASLAISDHSTTYLRSKCVGRCGERIGTVKSQRCSALQTHTHSRESSPAPAPHAQLGQLGCSAGGGI